MPWTRRCAGWVGGFDDWRCLGFPARHLADRVDPDRVVILHVRHAGRLWPESFQGAVPGIITIILLIGLACCNCKARLSRSPFLAPCGDIAFPGRF